MSVWSTNPTDTDNTQKKWIRYSLFLYFAYQFFFAEAAKLLQEAQDAVKLRDAEPSGRIQIRLPPPATATGGGGTSAAAGPPPPALVARFNHTHTVADLRAFIVAYEFLSLPRVVKKESAEW